MKTISFSAAVKKLVKGCFVKIPKLPVKKLVKTSSFSAAVKQLVNGCFVKIPTLPVKKSVKKLVKPCFVKMRKLLFQSHNYDQWCHAVRVKPKLSKEGKHNADLCLQLLDTLYTVYYTVYYTDSGHGYGEYVEEDYPFDVIKMEENAPEGIKIEAVEQQEEWKPNLNESLADIKIKLEKEEGIGYGEYVEEYYDEIKIEENAIGYGEYVEDSTYSPYPIAFSSVPDITDYYTITRLGRIVNKPYRYRCEPFPVKNKSVKRLPRRQRSILCN